MNDPLAALNAAGVSIRLDDLSREHLSGSLADLIAHRRAVGVTTNPAIFAKAIGNAAAHESQIHDLAVRGVAIGLGDEGAVVFETAWEALRQQLSARLSSSLAKAP